MMQFIYIQKLHKLKEFKKAYEHLNLLNNENEHTFESYLLLGKYYEFGISNETNLKKAIKFYKKSIELKPNIGEAYFRVSRTYRKLGDTAKQMEYLKKSSKTKYGAAFYWLGNYYFNGTHVDKNIKKSKYYYYFGSKYGHIPSKNNYSYIIIKQEKYFHKKFCPIFKIIIYIIKGFLTGIFNIRSKSISVYGEIDNINNPYI